MNPVWIVDDDQSIRFVLEKALAKVPLLTRSFSNAPDALKALNQATPENAPEVLISDIRMPGGSGITLLSTIKEKYPHIPVIIMTAYSDLDSAVSAFQSGAFEYISKPFDLNTVVELLQRAIDEKKHKSSAQGVADIDGYTGGLIGQAPAMQDVFRAIGRLSQSNVTVLITGESGTGKELIAQALHKHSSKAQGPFIAINTAAIPKDLLESELFGHEKGAFTGAQNMRYGRFEQATGGTLFLDEIGDMSFDLQTRLLRVLSEGYFYRVGGKEAIAADVRVIAATHQNLEKMVKQGLFREDLFHRLNVIRLRLPSLNERKEDIPLLVQHFLKVSARKLNGEVKQISTQAMDVLTQFFYAGNVRQLENICHWLTVMAPAQLIQVNDLPPEVLQGVRMSDAGGLRAQPVLVTGRSSFSRIHAIADAQKQNMFHPVSSFDEAQKTVATIQTPSWENLLEVVALQMLEDQSSDEPAKVWEVLSRRFESSLINAALQVTQGKRIEAASKLGIGRNTITRKIQELSLGEEQCADQLQQKL